MATYYDPYDYTETAAAWEALLGVAPGATRYRRAYRSLVEQPPFSSDMYTADDNPDTLEQHRSPVQRVLVADTPGRGARRA